MIDMKKISKKKQEEQHPREHIEEEDSPKSHSIAVFMRPDQDELVKVTDLEKKNAKKRLMADFKHFPQDEEEFEDS